MVDRFVTVGDDLNLPSSVKVPIARLVGLLSLDGTADSATKVAMTPTERAKLLGIDAGATANDTDANLKNRANHTGTQAISSVSGLQTQLDLKAPLASPTFTGTVGGITKAMVGLVNVDNTSDANKPVSTAQAAAIAAAIAAIPPSGGSSDTLTRVTLTGAYTLTPDPAWDTEATHAVVLTQDSTGSRVVTYASTVAASDGDTLPVISPTAGSETWIGFVWSPAISKWIPTLIQTITPPDTVPPTVGTMASSSIAVTTYTLTVTGASDARGLDSAPYSFSTDNGSSWSAWQTSNVYNVTGATANTAYNTKHKVRDAAGNVSTGSTVVVTTLPAFSYAQTAHAVDATDNTTYTFSGVAIGAAQSDRKVIVAVDWRAAAAVTLSSATIGGIAATIDFQGNVATSTGIAFISAIVPTGTTAAIVLNFSGTVVRVGHQTYRAVGATITPSSTAIHATGATVTNPTGGFVIASGFTPTNSLTGVTSVSSDVTEGYYFLGGTSNTVGSVTATVSGAFSGVGAVAYGVS